VTAKYVTVPFARTKPHTQGRKIYTEWKAQNLVSYQCRLKPTLLYVFHPDIPDLEPRSLT